jgi:hypothetical protein
MWRRKEVAVENFAGIGGCAALCVSTRKEGWKGGRKGGSKEVREGGGEGR